MPGSGPGCEASPLVVPHEDCAGFHALTSCWAAGTEVPRQVAAGWGGLGHLSSALVTTLVFRVTSQCLLQLSSRVHAKLAGMWRCP